MLLCKQITWSPLSAELRNVVFIRLPLHQVVVSDNFIDRGFQLDFWQSFFVSIVSGRLPLGYRLGGVYVEPTEAVVQV